MKLLIKTKRVQKQKLLISLPKRNLSTINCKNLTSLKKRLTQRMLHLIKLFNDFTDNILNRHNFMN